MSSHRKYFGAGALLLFWLASTPVAWAQRLYDQARDEKAQEVKKLAEKITSGELFAKQLDNLDKLATEDLNTYFLLARSAMRAEINSFTTWSDVDSVVSRVKDNISAPPTITAAELKQLQEALQVKIKALREKIAQMKSQVVVEKDTTLEVLLERIGDLSAVEQLRLELFEGNSTEAGKTANPNLKNALAEVTTMLTKLDALYDSYFHKLKAYKELQGAVAALQVPLQEVSLQALQVEEDHYTKLAAIYARREADEGNIRLLLDYYDAKVTKYLLNAGEKKDERVNETINAVLADIAAATNRQDRAAKRIEALDLLRTLYAASSLSARGSTAKDLADLREAQALQRYSIRKSAIKAKAYETIVSVGATRLALFYQGGIKPSDVAQLIYAAASSAIAPSILAK